MQYERPREIFFEALQRRASLRIEAREASEGGEKAKDMQNFYKSSLTSNDEIYCVRVISTETTCEVLWQDGSLTLKWQKIY